jgi:hypothetical protein
MRTYRIAYEEPGGSFSTRSYGDDGGVDVKSGGSGTRGDTWAGLAGGIGKK